MLVRFLVMYRLVGKLFDLEMIILCFGVFFFWICRVVLSILNRLIDVVLVIIILLVCVLIRGVSLLLRCFGRLC